MEREFTVLYQVELLSEIFQTYVLKPCKILEGFYDADEGLFETANDEQLLDFQSEEFVPSENEYCVGNCITETTLKKVYQQENVEIALMIFSTEMMENAIIMYYDVVNESFVLTNINLKNIEPLDYLGQNIEPGEPTYVSRSAVGNTEEDINKIIENIFVSSRKALNLPEDTQLTLLSIGEIEHLLSLTSKDEFINKLLEIMNNKETFADKFKDPEGYFLAMPDINIKLLLDHINLEQMKNELKNYYNVYATNAGVIKSVGDLDFDESEESRELNCEDLIISRENMMFAVLERSTLETIRYQLDIIKHNSKISLEQALTEIDDVDRFAISKYYFNKMIKAIDELLLIEDIEEIKKRYIILHYETEELYKEVANEIVGVYENSDDHIKKHDELSKMYEELFANIDDKAYIMDYKSVREKMVSRIIGRNSQIDTILTIIDDNDKLSNPSKKKSVIIAGSTGTGKTQTFLELKRILKDVRPVYIADTNQLTQAGYIGGSIEDNILLPLVLEAHEINNRKLDKPNPIIVQEDIELAQHGIVFLDEIDKRAQKFPGLTNVNENGVIIQLLKLMDPGTSYSIKVTERGRTILFDTTNLIVLSGGAFQEYFDKIRNVKPALGFGSEVKKDETTELFKYNEVDSEVLVKYGLDRQFIARHSKAVLYPPHTKESLIELENNINTSNLQVLKDKYAHDKIVFLWEDGYIEKAAEAAVKTGNGGRALVNIIERSLGNLSSEVKKRNKEFKAIFVPISAIQDSGTITLIRHDDTITFLADLVEETRLEDEAAKKITQITRDEDMYKEVIKLRQDIKIKTIGEIPKK